jgi:hypothetical protein
VSEASPISLLLAQANDSSDEDGLIDVLSAWLPSSALRHREVFGTAMAFLFGWVTAGD